ncbi:MAG: hypothetical protein J6A01_07225 [Proteobacteria bacterium]|nr:hypothetical protein [Pseudomonadota bacterium]
MDFLKEKAKKAALEKGRELMRMMDEKSSSNAASEGDGSQKSLDEVLDPAKAEERRADERLSAILDGSDSAPSASANAQTDFINPPAKASTNPRQEAAATPPATTSSNPPEKAAAKANAANKPANLQSTMDKSIDTYKNGQNLINRGKEFLELINSTKTRGIIAIACVVLSIVMGIATPIANHFITKHFEEAQQEETGVIQQTKDKLHSLKEAVLPSDTKDPKADAPDANETKRPAQAVVPAESPNGAAAPVPAANPPQAAAPVPAANPPQAAAPAEPAAPLNGAAAPVPAADSQVPAVPAEAAVPAGGQQPGDLSALFGHNISELSTTQLRGLVTSMQVVSNALNALISAPNAVDCSGAACEASYRQKMDELLKTHAAEIKDDPNTDREALLVAFGELKNTIQQSSNKLNAQFPQKAPNGVYQSVTNYLNP